MDGSGRASLRNRRFLRPIKPYISHAQSIIPDVSVTSTGQDSPAEADQGVQQLEGGPQDHDEQGEVQTLPVQ